MKAEEQDFGNLLKLVFFGLVWLLPTLLRWLAKASAALKERQQQVPPQPASSPAASRQAERSPPPAARPSATRPPAARPATGGPPEAAPARRPQTRPSPPLPTTPGRTPPVAAVAGASSLARARESATSLETWLAGKPEAGLEVLRAASARATATLADGSLPESAGLAWLGAVDLLWRLARQRLGPQAGAILRSTEHLAAAVAGQVRTGGVEQASAIAFLTLDHPPTLAAWQSLNLLPVEVPAALAGSSERWLELAWLAWRSNVAATPLALDELARLVAEPDAEAASPAVDQFGRQLASAWATELLADVAVTVRFGHAAVASLEKLAAGRPLSEQGAIRLSPAGLLFPQAPLRYRLLLRRAVAALLGPDGLPARQDAPPPLPDLGGFQVRRGSLVEGVPQGVLEPHAARLAARFLEHVWTALGGRRLSATAWLAPPTEHATARARAELAQGGLPGGLPADLLAALATLVPAEAAGLATFEGIATCLAEAFEAAPVARQRAGQDRPARGPTVARPGWDRGRRRREGIRQALLIREILGRPVGLTKPRS